MKNTIISFCKDVRVRGNLDVINFFILIITMMLMGCRIIPIETFAICTFFINTIRKAMETVACTDEEILQKNSLFCVILTNQQFTFFALMFIFTIVIYSINPYSGEVNSMVALLILFTLLVIIPILPFALSKLCKKILKK